MLGSGAYGEGFDSSTLLPTYKGVGILRGASDATPVVRTYLADQEDAEKILIAARALRERAGTLTGVAAGENVARAVRDVLSDVKTVFGADERGLQWTTLPPGCGANSGARRRRDRRDDLRAVAGARRAERGREAGRRCP